MRARFCAMALAALGAHGFLLPGAYDACDASRQSNFSSAYALEADPSSGAGGLFRLVNYMDPSTCAVRVPHPIDAAYQALGWGSCDDAIRVRFNTTRAEPPVAPSTSFTHLKLVVTGTRGAVSTGFALSNFQFFFNGIVVPIASARVYPQVIGVSCGGALLANVSTAPLAAWPGACAQGCAQTSGCVSYSVDDATTCSFYSSLDAACSLGEGLNFYVQGFQPLAINTDCFGNDLVAFNGPYSVMACTQFCLRTPSCSAFFHSASGACFLKYLAVPSAVGGSPGGQCYVLTSDVDVSANLLQTGTSLQPMYGYSAIDFTLVTGSRIDSYSFVTSTVDASYDPTSFELFYSTDNMTWTSLGKEEGSPLVPKARAAAAGPFALQAASLLVPPVLPAQHFSTGLVGTVVNTPPRHDAKAWRYYRWVPLSSQGPIDCSGWTCTCLGLTWAFCIDIGEFQLFYNGVQQRPVGATLVSPNYSPSYPTFSVNEPYIDFAKWGLLAIDGDPASTITIAMPSSNVFLHNTPYYPMQTLFEQNSGVIAYSGTFVQVDMGQPVPADGYRVAMGANAAHNPVSWIVQGSNDQLTWADLHYEVADEVAIVPTPIGNQGFPAFLDLGCFNDYHTPDYHVGRALPVLFQSDSMTVELCAAAAWEAGLQYFALQDGSFCHASNDLYHATSAGAYPTFFGGCQSACAGNSNENCGGPYENFIYLFIKPAPVIGVTDYAISYIGCFHDDVTSDPYSGRAMQTLTADYSGMTVEACAQLARSRGFQFFGLQYGAWCAASNLLSDATAVGANPGGCTQPCTGNSAEICGGAYTNQIYAIVPASQYQNQILRPNVLSGALELTYVVGPDWPVPYTSYNARLGITPPNGFTSIIPFSQMPPSPTYSAPWYSLETEAGEVVVASFYRGWSAVNTCATCGGCAAQPATSGVDGLVVLSLVNSTCLGLSIYGPDRKPPSVATTSPTSSPVASLGTVTCQLTADQTIDFVCVNGRDVTSAVTPGLENWSTLKSLSFPFPGNSPGRFTIGVTQAECCNQDTGFVVQCSYPNNTQSSWNFVSSVSNGWRAILANASNSLPADVCSMQPSGQVAYIGPATSVLTDALAVGATPIATPVTVTPTVAFTFAVAGSAPAPSSEVDFDQVFFSRLVRPVGNLDPTPFPSASPTNNPTGAPINFNLSALRLTFYVGEDPAAASGQVITRTQSQPCPENYTLVVARSQYRYMEIGQAAHGDAAVAPFFSTGYDFTQATVVASMTATGPFRFFGEYVCGCDTVQLALLGTGLSTGTIYCPAVDECPQNRDSDPFGVGTATCGNGDYTYVTCIDAGPFSYGYSCKCDTDASYNAVTFQSIRTANDVNASSYEIISCKPLPITVLTSNIGVWPQPNVTFNTTFSLWFYDSARIVAKNALSPPGQSANAWTNRLIEGGDTSQVYLPCTLSSGLDVQCVQSQLDGFIFEAEFFNATDASIVVFNQYFTLPCGCTTMWLSSSTPDPRPDDGRPKNFKATQNLGQVSFSWIDDSYCALKFKFVRSFFDPAVGAFGVQQSFIAAHEASGGAAGTSKCLGDSGDSHFPSPAVLSDRMLDQPLLYLPGQVVQYCIAATADETANKPRYVSAFSCTSVSVMYEARFLVSITRPDTSPDWDSQGGVTVTYTVYDPASNATNKIPLFTARNTTTQDGTIQIKLNMSIEDYPTIAGVQKLQVGFLFSKTSYYADTNTTVVHTFLCNNGRSQCNPSYPNLMVVPHFSFDALVLTIQDNTYAAFSGYVGVGSLLQPSDSPVAPGFWNCPLANVKLSFAEYPGTSSTDTQYGSATTDQTGYYHIELPIGARAVITSIQLMVQTGAGSSSSTMTATARAHQFVLATDGANYSSMVFPILGQPLSGVNFVDVTMETVFVDVAGGACNTSIARTAYLILTRNNEFCIPPQLSASTFPDVSSSGWPIPLSPITNEYYSLAYGTGVRFMATVPAQFLEIIAYVNTTVDGRKASALSVNTYFFQTLSQSVVDFRDLPELGSEYYSASNFTTLVTQAPSAPIVVVSKQPTASPVANLTLTAIFNSRNATEAFERARLVRFQFDGAPTVTVAFFQDSKRIDLAVQTCSDPTATLYLSSTMYLDTSLSGAQQPVYAVFNVSQIYFAGLTCSYIPNGQLMINNQLGLSLDANCPTTGAPCTVPLSAVSSNLVDPVTGAHIPDGSSAYYIHKFTASATNLAPYSNVFQFAYLGPQYPPAQYPVVGTVLQVFVMGQSAPQSTANPRTFAVVETMPIAIVWQAPGSLSSSTYNNVRTTVTRVARNVDFYHGVVNDISVDGLVGVGADACAGGGFVVEALICLKGTAAVTGNYHGHFENGLSETNITARQHTRTLTWSVDTNGGVIQANNVQSGKGAQGDIFVFLTEVWVFVETDDIILGTACQAGIERSYKIMSAPSNTRTTYVPRWAVQNELLPGLEKIILSNVGNSNIYEQLAASAQIFRDILNLQPSLAPDVAASTSAFSGQPDPTTGVVHLSFAGGAAAVTYNLINDDLVYSSYSNDTSTYAYNGGGVGAYLDALLLVVKLSLSVDYAHGVKLSNDVSVTVQNTWDQSTTVGFVLLDAQASDYFNVDVWLDQRYGTFAFSTVSGQSRCPHEPGTLYVEQPNMYISQQVSSNISPGNAAAYTVWIENLGNSDVDPSQGLSAATFVLSMDMKAFADGVTVLVNDQQMSYAGLRFANISQQSKFPVQIQLYQGVSLSSYSLALYLNTECGFDGGSFDDQVSIQLVANFIANCPSVDIGGVFDTVSSISLISGAPTTLDLVFRNLGSGQPIIPPWANTSNVAAVHVEWSFDGTDEWNVVKDALGRPVDLMVLEDPLTNFAVVTMDLSQMPSVATILVGAVVRCRVPVNANQLDQSLFASFSGLGVVFLDYVQPSVVSFEPRSQINPGDVLSVTLSETVDCAGLSFGVYLLQPPGPSLPAFGGLSIQAENLVVKCSDDTIAVSIKPGAANLYQMAGQTWYMVLTNLKDVAGNPVKTNIPLTSPWYLYAQDGNIEVALTFAPLDPASTRFSVTALELVGLTDPTHHGNFVVGGADWLNVVGQIQQAVAGNVGISPSRVDVKYFWFSPGFAPICTVNVVVNPASPAVQGENLIAAFRSAYPALFNSNGAQSIDLLPMTESDKIKAQMDSLEEQLNIVQTSLISVQQQLGILLKNLVPSYTPSPSTSQSPVTSVKPTPFPTFQPVPRPTTRPSRLPTTGVPVPRPTRFPTAFPSHSPTKPTKYPSASPLYAPPSASPRHHPTTSPTHKGATYRPSKSPTRVPTTSPTWAHPSKAPTKIPTRLPTQAPIYSPSISPSSGQPSLSPYKSYPSSSPTSRPIISSSPTTVAPLTSLAPSTTKVPSTSKPNSARPTTKPSSSSPTSKSPSSKSPVSGRLLRTLDP